MKKALLFLMVGLFSLNLATAQEEYPLDESLIVNVKRITNKGYISIRDLPKATRLDINETNSEIVSYDFSWKSGDDLVTIHVTGAEFPEQVKAQLAEFKIGAKFYIEKIIVDNASGRVRAKEAVITVKS